MKRLLFTTILMLAMLKGVAQQITSACLSGFPSGYYSVDKWGEAEGSFGKRFLEKQFPSLHE